MKLKLTLVILLIPFLFSTTAFAKSKKGTVSKSSMSHNGCNITKMTVKYSLGHFFGEPTNNGAFKWSKGGGTSSDCLTHDVKVYLEVKPENSIQTTFVELSPTVPKAGRGYGMNTTGSPSWDAFFCAVGGGSCMDKQSAKTVMKGNYRIVGFRLSGGTKAKNEKEARKAKVQRERQLVKDREIQREKERQQQVALKRQREQERQRQAALEKQREQQRQRQATIERQHEQERLAALETKRKKRAADTHAANEILRKQRNDERSDVQGAEYLDEVYDDATSGWTDEHKEDVRNSMDPAMGRLVCGQINQFKHPKMYQKCKEQMGLD